MFDNRLTITSNNKQDIVSFKNKALGRRRRYYGPLNEDDLLPHDLSEFLYIELEILMKEFETKGRTKLKSVFSFDSFVPVPKEILVLPYEEVMFRRFKEKHPSFFNRFPDIISGAEWESKNWGCRHGASYSDLTEHIDNDFNFLIYTFTTTDDCSPFYSSLIKMYPHFDFSLNSEKTN
jgi:hypothetical protein